MKSPQLFWLMEPWDDATCFEPMAGHAPHTGGWTINEINPCPCPECKKQYYLKRKTTLPISPSISQLLGHEQPEEWLIHRVSISSEEIVKEQTEPTGQQVMNEGWSFNERIPKPRISRNFRKDVVKLVVQSMFSLAFSTPRSPSSS